VNSPTVLTTAGEILLPGAGGGIVIVDAWSHQPVCMVTDMGDDKNIAMHLTLSPTSRVATVESDMEIHESRTADYPVRFEEVFIKDKHGNTRSRFRLRQS
jgi:hypothetical protein